MSYIDGFVIAVPTANKQKFRIRVYDDHGRNGHNHRRKSLAIADVKILQRSL